MGGFIQRRGGTARHDAVAWGYARAADQLGVDIIQNCEVTGFNIKKGAITGVKTVKGEIKANKVGCVVAGHAGVVAEWQVLDFQLTVVRCKHWYQNPSNP